MSVGVIVFFVLCFDIIYIYIYTYVYNLFNLFVLINDQQYTNELIVNLANLGDLVEQEKLKLKKMVMSSGLSSFSLVISIAF
jgi:hypothetical protein